MTEKLASGFLKPFLNHLRAVEEQVAAGCESVRLECPQIYNGRSWFTKGTLERFVRFVSTPEVLERVKSIEDELIQLEQVRNIQASGLPQAEDPFLGADSIYSRKDGKAFSRPFGNSGKLVGNSIEMPKRYPYDAIESGSEASKVELLRAMDVRLLALRQEQSTAFGRAAAAGFSSANMTDLMSFSEYFGADRLRVACVNFLIVSQRTVAEPTKHNLQAISSDCDMSLPKAGVFSEREDSPQASARLSQSNRAPLPNGKHYSEDEKALLVKDGLLSAQIEETHSDSLPDKETDVTELSKKSGPMNIHPDSFGGQNRINPAFANINVEVTSIKQKTEASFLKIDGAHSQEPSWALMNDAAGRQAAHNLGDLVQDSGMAFKDTAALKMDQSSNSRVVFDVVIDPYESNLLPDKQIINIVKFNASHDQEHNQDNISAPARRLSVQEAISMFEDKKKKEAVKAPGKQHLGKQESGRMSLDATNESSSGSLTSRRQSASNGCEVAKALQGSREARKGTGDVSMPRQDLHIIEPQANPSPKASDSSFDQLPPTMKPEKTSGKVSALKECNLGATSGKALENKLQDTSHSKLEKSTAQGTLARDLAVKQGPSKIDSNLSMPRTDDFLNSGYSDKSPEMMGSGSRKPEKVNLSTRLWQPMSMQDSSNLGCPSLEVDAVQNGTKSSMVPFETKQAIVKEQHSKDVIPKVFAGSEMQDCSILGCPSLEVDTVQNSLKSSMASFETKQANVVKEQCSKDAIAKVFFGSESVPNDQSSQRESFGSFRTDSFQYDMQDYIGMDVDQASDGVDNLSDHRGRFYEQYRKLRDAKLMQENVSRRAQREAKFRSMEETLLLRKAELDARTMRQNHHEARAAKLQARKAEFYILQREKEDGGDEKCSEIGGYSIGPSISLPFTPLEAKDQASVSKSQSRRKSAAGSTKGTTPPRSATRGTSVSPKLTPRSATGSTTKPRKSTSSSGSENHLAKSLPSLGNLRKENTKPSAGRPSGNAGLLGKDGGFGRFCDVSEVHPLEVNVNGLVCTPPNYGPSKDDKLGGASFVRKSCFDAKILSTSRDDGISASPKPVEYETVALSKSKHDGAGTFQEAKESAENGSNSGLVCLHGMVQQLPLPIVEATYTSNEERGPVTQSLESNRTTNGSEQISEEIQGTNSQRDAYYEVENMDIDVTDRADSTQGSGSTKFPALQIIATAHASDDKELQLDLQGATETACHTLSITVDSSSEESNLTQDLKCYPQCQVQHSDEDGLQNRNIAKASTSFHASSLLHEPHLPVFFNASASPSNSRVVQASGHISPPSATTLESPLQSPASWKSSQIYHASEEAEINQMNKKWVGPKKFAIVASTTKESAKGFRRLLKFARKNRTLDATTTDWVSTSEGDDEIEDQRLSIDELNTRGRLEERIAFGINGQQNITPDQLSAAQFLRSSIPTPPTNFRLRDDHLMGSTMLKAPKSFFLLSSFRNKGIEGKAR